MSHDGFTGTLVSPELSDLLGVFEEAQAKGLRVALPGVVKKYDSTTHLASVQPTVQRRGIGGGETIDLPVIPQVPVCHPRTAAASVVLPVKPGDLVTLLFSDRALDRWKYGSGSSPVPPDADRAHDLTDCWAIIGGYPAGAPFAPQYPDALEVQLASGTKIAVTNGSVELLSVLHEVVEYVEQTITFSNGGGPTGPPTNASILSTIKAKLEQLKVT